MPYVNAPRSIPVERLLSEAARVIDKADQQHRDLSDTESAKVDALLTMAESVARPLSRKILTRSVR